MRRLLSFAFLICLFSCAGNHQTRKAFDQAESMMSTAPDSVLFLIRGVDERSLPTKSLRARHALLLTMAQDKNYIDVAKDSTILVAYDYYQHHGRKTDRLLSTYYLGVIRQNAGEYIDAALAFREAEPLAEALGDDRQLSLIEQHLSRIFALNYDHVRALEYAQKSLEAAERAGDTVMAGYCRYDLAVQQLAEYRFEEAESNIQRMLDASKGNAAMYSFAAKKMAEVLLSKTSPDWEKAKIYYDEVAEKQAVSLNFRDYGLLALISEKGEEHAKAEEYLRIAESRISTPADSAIFYNDCRNVFDERKDWRNAYHAQTRSTRILYKMTIEALGQSLTHAMESFYVKEWALEQERSRTRLLLFILLGTITFFAFLILYVLLRRRNRRILDDMASIQDVSSELVDTLVAEKVKSLQKLSESFFSWDDEAIVRREQRKGRLTKEEIIVSFRTQLSELRNDRSIINTLEQSLNLTDNGIMQIARHHLHNEKELDFSVLTLLFSGFSIKSISYLLRMSEASLRMRKTRFKQQFETMQDPIRSQLLAKLG